MHDNEREELNDLRAQKLFLQAKVDIFIGLRCPWGPIYGSASLWIQHLFADLPDATLADEDANSILTDNANNTDDST